MSASESTTVSSSLASTTQFQSSSAPPSDARRASRFDATAKGHHHRDNAPLSADAVVYWRIVDPELAHYAVKDLVPAIQNLVLTQLRSEIGKLTLDETFSARQKMNAWVLLADLDAATDVGCQGDARRGT